MDKKATNYCGVGLVCQNFKSCRSLIDSGGTNVKWLFFSSVVNRTLLVAVVIAVLAASLSVGIHLTAFLPNQSKPAQSAFVNTYPYN